MYTPGAAISFLGIYPREPNYLYLKLFTAAQLIIKS